MWKCLSFLLLLGGMVMGGGGGCWWWFERRNSNNLLLFVTKKNFHTRLKSEWTFEWNHANNFHLRNPTTIFTQEVKRGPFKWWFPNQILWNCNLKFVLYLILSAFFRLTLEIYRETHADQILTYTFKKVLSHIYREKKIDENFLGIFITSIAI